MKSDSSWRRWRTLAAAVVLVAGAIAVGYVASTASAKSHATITLRVSLFGDFGYHDLYKQFEASHPNIDIKEDIQSYPDHHGNLAKHLATGAGADDIEAIEVGFIAQFTATPQYFVNLNSYGAKSLKNRWLSWKWRQSIARNGAQIGFGTDVGSLAICYRADLFRRAGLPTTPAKVSALWPTWQKYIAAGVRYQKHSPKDTHFFDSASNVYNAMVGQLTPAYYSATGKLIVEHQPEGQGRVGHRELGIKKGESAGYAAFSTDWNAGFKNGQVRDRDVPRLDDGLHPGPGAGHVRQVEHRGRPWRRRQLGRLVPRHPQAVVAPEGGVRADQVPHLSRRGGVRLQTDGQPAEPAGPAEEQGRAELQEPVLQQRGRRQGLCQFGAEAEAADPGPASG